MAFVQQGTGNDLGNRAFSLRGMGAEPVRVFYVREERTLSGMGQDTSGLIDPLTGQLYSDETPIQQSSMPISTPPSSIPASLMAPFQPNTMPAASWSDWFKQESIVPKVPNWALAGLGGMLLLAFMPAGGSAKRRRR